MGRSPGNWAARDPAEAYVELEHPADLFLEIRGDDVPALFENALFAFYDQVAVLGGFAGRREVTLTAAGASPAEALRALLSEALYRFETEGFVAVGAKVQVEPAGGDNRDARSHGAGSAARGAGVSAAVGGGGATRVTAVLSGEKADRRRHTLLAEIKAVTYHRLSLAPAAGGWRATVLFDV